LISSRSVYDKGNQANDIHVISATANQQ